MKPVRKAVARTLTTAITALRTNMRSIIATIALAAVAVGLWMERPSLALIIPGGVVFALLAWSHARGATEDA